MNSIDHYLYFFDHESPHLSDRASLLSLTILLKCYHALCNIQQEKGYLQYERIIQVVEYFLHQHNHFVHPSDVKNLLYEVYVALLSEALVSSDIGYLTGDAPHNLQMKTYLVHYDEYNFVQITLDVLQSHYDSLMRSQSLSTKDMHFFSQQRHPMIADLESQASKYSSQHQKEAMRSQQQHFVGGNSQRPHPHQQYYSSSHHHNTPNNAEHYSNNNIPIPIAPALSNKFHQFANNDKHFHHVTTTNHPSSFNNQQSFGNFSTRAVTGGMVNTSSLPAPGWFIFSSVVSPNQ